MKFLLLSIDGAGLPIAMKLKLEGNDVAVYIHKNRFKHLYDGMIKKLEKKEWGKWIDDQTIIIFDTVKSGRIADRLRRQGHYVVGAGEMNDKMELDRQFGMELAKKAGLKVPPEKEFTNFDEAKAFVQQTKKRYIMKPSGNIETWANYPSKGWKDMVRMLDFWKKNWTEEIRFVLQEMIDGQQMSIEGWYDGKKWSGFNCFDEETEILTKEGWKKFSQLSMEDEVATLNAESRTLEYQKPTHLFKYRYEGEMWTYESGPRTRINFCVTPNHKFYYYDYHSLYKLESKEIREITHQVRIPRTAKWRGKRQDTFAGIDMKVWLRFLGLYIAEGSCRNSRPQIIIAQSRKSKRFGLVQEIVEDFALASGAEWHYYADKFFCLTYCEPFYSYLRKLGHAKEKHIPREMLELDVEYLECLFEGLTAGDGHAHQPVYFTASKTLADDVQELLLKLGYVANIKRLTKGQHEWFYLYYHKYDATLNPKKIKKVSYKGYVYSCEVPNHIVYVRRSGMPMFCGQSTFEYKPLMRTYSDTAPFTGECGSVVFYYGSELGKLYDETFARLIPHLEGYPPGPLDVNCILNEDGAWFLEFTARQGYPATYIQLLGVEDEWGKVYSDIARGQFGDFHPKAEWITGVRFCVPQWPYGRVDKAYVGAPLFTHFKKRHLENIVFLDVYLDEVLRCGGTDGELGTCVGWGQTIDEASQMMYDVLKEVATYPMFYRPDIGEGLDLQSVKDWGYYIPSGGENGSKKKEMDSTGNQKTRSFEEESQKGRQNN